LAAQQIAVCAAFRAAWWQMSVCQQASQCVSDCGQRSGVKILHPGTGQRLLFLLFLVEDY